MHDKLHVLLSCTHSVYLFILYLYILVIISIIYYDVVYTYIIKKKILYQV